MACCPREEVVAWFQVVDGMAWVASRVSRTLSRGEDADASDSLDSPTRLAPLDVETLGAQAVITSGVTMRENKARDRGALGSGRDKMRARGPELSGLTGRVPGWERRSNKLRLIFCQWLKVLASALVAG